MFSQHEGVPIDLFLYLLPAPRLNLKCIEEVVSFVFVVSEARVFVYHFRHLQSVLNFYIPSKILFMADNSISFTEGFTSGLNYFACR